MNSRIQKLANKYIEWATERINLHTPSIIPAKMLLTQFVMERGIDTRTSAQLLWYFQSKGIL